MDNPYQNHIVDTVKELYGQFPPPLRPELSLDIYGDLGEITFRPCQRLRAHWAELHRLAQCWGVKVEKRPGREVIIGRFETATRFRTFIERLSQLLDEVVEDQFYKSGNKVVLDRRLGLTASVVDDLQRWTRAHDVCRRLEREAEEFWAAFSEAA